jgi:glycosyltransferase involved in cell wall biosynthesis
MRIPVIINNRDLLTWPMAMVNKISLLDGIGEIVIVDNESTYEPLLDWYCKQNIAKVVYCNNLGHAGAWISNIVNEIGAKYYVVTDSDLGIDHIPIDTLSVFQNKLMSNKALLKIGLGLNWEIVNKDSPYFDRLNLFEKDRWHKSSVIDDVYVDVPIDTTFAMYRVQNYFIGGGSLTYPYVARHYPWELSLNHNNEEFSYYIKRASASSSYKMIVPC